MAIDYAEALKRGLKFCVQPKRWLPFFIIDLAFFSAALAVIMANVPYFIYFLAGMEASALAGPAASLFLTLFGLLIGWVLIGIWVNGAIIHQSRKEKEFRKSWGISGRRYPSLLGIVLVTVVLAMLVSWIPYVGWLISILIGLVLFFSMQSIIVKGNGFVPAMEESWNIFRSQPFRVFIMWLLIVVISLLIMAVFALPAIALLISVVADLAAGGSVTSATLISIVLAMENQLPALVVSCAIFILGMGIMRVFSIKAQTEFYLQLKKHKK